MGTEQNLHERIATALEDGLRERRYALRVDVRPDQQGRYAEAAPDTLVASVEEWLAELDMRTGDRASKLWDFPGLTLVLDAIVREEIGLEGSVIANAAFPPPGGWSQ
jgi:hypothetical protein